jgi:alpha-glucosidase
VGEKEGNIINNIKMRNKLILFLMLFAALSCTQHNSYKMESPDGKIELTLISYGGELKIEHLFEGDTIIKRSPIGLHSDNLDLTRNISVSNVEVSKVDETWNTVNGKNKQVRNHYQQYTYTLKHSGNDSLTSCLVFRCFNDGFAYRFKLSGASNDSIAIRKELTTLRFTNDFTYWAYNGEHHNLGPLKRSGSPMDEIRPPMVLELQDSLYMAIHEAAIVKYAPFSLNTLGEGNSIAFNVEEIKDEKEINTSWRSFIIGRKPGDLVESNLLVNLNETCKIEDTSWIKPGKSLWDWRVWGYKTAEGFEYGLNTVSHKRFIDFAAENNIQYLLIDADWYGPEFNDNSNPTQARQGIDIEECMAYAKEKGVGIILYLNDVGAKKFGLERVLKQFSDWGAAGVKYGFMQGSWEDKVRHTRNVVELCAKYRLMVDFHDNPVPPSGDRRTYPNLVTREYCHAQADAKRSYFPETAVTSPFVNMIAGPLDYTNGWFDLDSAQVRERVFEKIPGTVSAEVAKLIVTYSGWMVLPDSPEEYLEKEDLFDCIRKMPAQFDSFKILDGKIGEYISVVRQAGDNWFIGLLTNREPRNVSIDLKFLPKGENYLATIYSDTEDTHYLHNKESYKVKSLKVSVGDKLNFYMAPGGGGSIYLEKIELK